MLLYIILNADDDLFEGMYVKFAWSLDFSFDFSVIIKRRLRRKRSYSKLQTYKPQLHKNFPATLFK